MSQTIRAIREASLSGGLGAPDADRHHSRRDRRAGGLEGYTVEAIDGEIGVVIAAGDDAVDSHLLASGATWNGGRTMLLPVALIDRVDRERASVHLACSRQEIADAPPFEYDRHRDAAYRLELAVHYGVQQDRRRASCRGRLDRAMRDAAGSLAEAAVCGR